MSESQKNVDSSAEEVKKDKNSIRSEEAVVRAQRKTSWKIIVAVVVLLCVLTGFGSARLYMMLAQGVNGNNNPLTQHQSLANDGNKSITQEEQEIAGVVDNVSPSVVSIVTQSQGGGYYGAQAVEGAGTGIIVGKDGYILTNKHVVDGASTVSVVLADGTNYSDVKVLGSDPLNDVAFLKIANVSNLPAAQLGDSSSVRVGEKVIAIGNSLGQYQNTVTSGIISGTGRPISAQAGNSVEDLTDLLQTDAAINPGNSGGPLLNLKGQVIGINTATIENAQGLGFSIPINSTKGILKGVLAGKDVQRAYLGVSYIPITADVATHYNLPVKKGAYVYSGSEKSAIVNGSPADKAGIKDKDIITKVGSIAVGDQGGISSLIGEYAPGDTIELTLLRDGKTLTVKVTLSAYKS